MKKKLESVALVGLLCCLMAALNVEAANVDPAAAQSVAQRFVQAPSARKVMKSGMTLRLAHVENSVATAAAADYYVFNASDGSAFVIVAGDDRAEQILAYGEGTIDMNNLPCNLQYWLGQYKQQMEWLLAHPEAVSEPHQTTASDLTVAPMLTCTWSQSEPYYNMCPEYEGEHSVTGCVATAMAQVMHYWRFPSMTPSLNPYRTRSHNIQVPAIGPREIEWDNMLDSYTGPYTPQQAEAVAVLMRYCGQSVQMDYSPDGSGAYVTNQLQGMLRFGYSRTASIKERSQYSLEDWEDMMCSDLQAGRPILYAANDAQAGGHAFVVDGCHDGLFHINWGWAGTGNGYFALGAFCVRGYKFTSNQEMIHNVTPGSQTPPESGHDFVRGGICYKFNEDRTGVLVTYNDTRYSSYDGNVTIPAQVTYEGATLPVTGIGISAFRNCESLMSVTIPATVTTVGDYAFRNCTGLRDLQLPDGLLAIGSQAFANCLALQSINVPQSLESIGAQAFQDCLSMTRVDVPSLEKWLQISFADHYANPLCSSHHLFVDGQELTDLVIPATISAVSPFAFIDCEGLTSLTLESGVTRVGDAAFAYCTGLTSLSLPETLTTLEQQAFFGCNGLTTVALPASITSIKRSAFSSCAGLASVSLPSSLTAVEDGVFSDCTSLTTVDFPASVTAIGASAFSGCTALESLSIPENVSVIGSKAFNGCTALSSVDIPSSVTTIGSSAFAGCSALTAIALPSSVVALGDRAFNNCSGLKEVTLPESLTVIDKMTFANCTELTSVRIPDAVTVIGEEAFYKCLQLNEVTLGTGVQTIDKMAFNNNPRMRVLTSLAPTPPELYNADVFNRSLYKSMQVKVPIEYREIYKTSGLWSWFTNLVGVNYGVKEGDVNGDGAVNIADINMLTRAISMAEYGYTLDVNGDGAVNIADVNMVITLIMQSR